MLRILELFLLLLVASRGLEFRHACRPYTRQFHLPGASLVCQSGVHVFVGALDHQGVGDQSLDESVQTNATGAYQATNLVLSSGCLDMLCYHLFVGLDLCGSSKTRNVPHVGRRWHYRFRSSYLFFRGRLMGNGISLLGGLFDSLGLCSCLPIQRSQG